MKKLKSVMSKGLKKNSKKFWVIFGILAFGVVSSLVFLVVILFQVLYSKKFSCGVYA